ncbi:MAG: type IV pilus secretin PilQ [Pseudomonadota bacterium]
MVRTSVTGLLAGAILLGIALEPADVALAQAEAQRAAAALQAVEVVPGDITSVRIALSGPVNDAAVASFLLSNPERLVVEIPGVSAGEGPLQVSGVGGLITNVTTERVSDAAGDLLRVSLLLDHTVGHVLRTEEGAIVVDLVESAASAPSPIEAEGFAVTNERTLSGPAISASAPPTVATLDFQSLDDVARVIIGMNAGIAYEVSKPEGRLIVVDFKGAGLAASLDRPLDASEFLSPVSMVRAYRTRGGARVAISLRRDVEYQTRRGAGNLLYIDIDMPADMRQDRDLARQGFTAAAPSTPASAGGTGLGSAYKDEVLIGSGGRTARPQDVYGAGAGSSDPASVMGMAAGFMFDSSSATNIPYSGQRINLDLVNADIHSVFRLISHVSKLNIVAGDDVSGRVTVRLENVPWDQAFAAILQAKGMGSQRFGNIVRIAPIDTIKAEQQSALEAKQAAFQLKDLQTYVVPLNYATAADLVGQITAVLSERGKVQVDPRTNQLIVQDLDDRIAAVRELVRQLDTQNPQVLIEARVVEASSSFSRGLGVEWGSELNASAATGFATGAFFPNSIGVSGGLVKTTNLAQRTFYEAGQDTLLVDLGSPTGEYGALAMHLGSIPGLVDLDARLSAMESEGWGKVVSSPRVVTMDNQSASITQGAQIPYLATSAGGANVRLVQAALELEVTPHITSDGRIFLDLSVTNNRPDFSQSVQGQPAIQIKEAKTGALVDNGDTTVIGGVYAFETSEAYARIPLLSKIPLLGYLFKNSGTKLSRNELLVFVSPRILSTTSSTASR